MTRAIIYARFSPRPDAAESESNVTQIELCTDYALRHGWTVAGVHQDAGLSGDDEDRPGLWAAIDQLSRGSVLLVYKLDRLARSVYLAHCIEQAVDRAGARIVSVAGEGTTSNSPEDVLVRRILQALAEYQKRAQAARTRAAMLRHQAAGRRMSGQTPLGTMPDPARPDRLADADLEQAAIRRIRELAALGYRPRALARQLDLEGYQPRGQRWWHTTISRLLKRTH